MARRRPRVPLKTLSGWRPFSTRYVSHAHIPALDLTTHGSGIEGATAVAGELTEEWVVEKRAHGETPSR